jgi:hypothetical protein
MPTRFILTSFLIGLLLLALGSAPAPALAQGLKLPVSGTVISVNPELRTLQLGADTFYVPEGVTGFEALAPGATVLIHYKSANGRSVVTKIEAAEPE